MTVRGSSATTDSTAALASVAQDIVGILAHGVVGEDDIGGGEGLAVVPGHAVTNGDGKGAGVGVVLVPRGQPGDELAGLEVGVEEVLVRDLMEPSVEPGWRSS